MTATKHDHTTAPLQANPRPNADREGARPS
jgi:hypothetical protein